MRTFLWPGARLVFLVLLAGTLCGWSRPDTAALNALADARQAQALLGPAVWSEVLQIENLGRRSPYPATVFAVVFELEGILWFYTDTDGTQSLSLRRNRVPEDKGALEPLLRAIEPGFAHWAALPEDPAAPVVRSTPLPNGCFIASLAALRGQVAAGRVVGRPRLLSYYIKVTGGLRGHTVLTYQGGSGWTVVDSERSAQPMAVPAGLEDDPRKLAEFLLGRPAAAARTLPIEDFAAGLARARYAGLPPVTSRAS